MKHLTTDELVDRLYGVGDAGHNCEACAERLEQLRERRQMAAEAVPESHEVLAAQRRNIYARMGEKPQAGLKWVPALAAAACLAVVGLVATHSSPVTSPMVVKTEIDDAQLFSDVYSMEQSMEPVAGKPIHAMFEQDQQ